MSKSRTNTSSLSNKPRSLIGKPAEYAKRTTEISFVAAKRLVNDQIEFGSAVATLGLEQLKSLRDLRTPMDFLKRQKIALATFGTTAKSLVGQARSTVGDARRAYVEIGKELVSDVSKSVRPSA